VGKIGATGHYEDDLEQTRQQFSDSQGFAPKDLAVANLPLPKAPWHQTWFVSVSFILASF